MIAKYQKELIVSSIVILLPAFVSLWFPELHSLWAAVPNPAGRSVAVLSHFRRRPRKPGQK